MDENILCDQIVSFCQTNSDRAIVEKYSRYFKDGKEGYDAYGISTELIHKLVKELGQKDDLTIDLLMKAAPSLLSSGKYEETILLILLVEKRLKNMHAAHFEEVAGWFEFGILNWAHCDTLSAKIIPWFFQKKLVAVERLAAWQNVPYRFQRRSLAVSMIKLLKSTNDFTPFFKLITPLMVDSERVVHQGLGWFLREAWKKEPAQTEKFLMIWKDRSARLIFQYATEKMDKEQRIRFKKEF